MQHPDAEPEAGNAAPPPPTIGKAPRVDRPSCERQTLILVGGSVRAASESAQRAGIDVVAVDAFGDRETHHAARRWIALETLQKQTPQSLGAHPERGATIAFGGGVAGNLSWLGDLGLPFYAARPELFRQLECPDVLRDIAERAGIDFPETRRIEAAVGDAAELNAGEVSGSRTRWLIKQPDSCGGLGVAFLRSTDQCVPGATLQRHLSGRAFGATYVGDGRTAVWIGLSRQLTRRCGDHPFVFAGCLGPIRPPTGLERRLRRLGDAIVAATGLRGPFNADLMLDGDRVGLLEINPRYSASMEVIEAAFGVSTDPACSFFDSAARWRTRLDAIAADKPDFYDATPMFLKRVLFSEAEYRVDPKDFPLARDPVTDSSAWKWTDVPAAPQRIEPNAPVATVIARLDRISLRNAYRIKYPRRPNRQLINQPETT